MRMIKKRVSKTFLFVCLSLPVATIVFAGMVRVFGVSDSPGRPSAYDIEADWAKIMFKKPRNNGGSSIISYRVEYKEVKEAQWKLETNLGPQNSVYDVVNGTVNNRVGYNNPVAFRAFAENAAGRSAPSAPSDPITFRDPF